MNFMKFSNGGLVRTAPPLITSLSGGGAWPDVVAAEMAAPKRMYTF